MNLNNQELIQELEKRIRTQQVTLEVQPDTIKQCPWSNRQAQLVLKVENYQLNLTKLFEEIRQEKSHQCNCPSCPKDFFSFFHKSFKFC